MRWTTRRSRVPARSMWSVSRFVSSVGRARSGHLERRVWHAGVEADAADVDLHHRFTIQQPLLVIGPQDATDRLKIRELPPRQRPAAAVALIEPEQAIGLRVQVVGARRLARRL